MMNNALREIVSSSVGVEGAEGAEEAFEGLFDDFDTSSTRLGKTVADRNKRILQLMDGIGNMDLGDTEDARVDLLATPTSS
jgi:type I restriction enzyme M protein